MNDNVTINRILRQKAISSGLCEIWQQEWKYDWDSERMVSQFYRGIDFFLKYRFMSNEDFKEYFDKDFLRNHGVLVDDRYSLLNPKNAILIGNSQSTVRINSYNVCTVYAVDCSSVNVIAKNSSFVMIHLLGQAKAEVCQDDKAKAVVIRHSPDNAVTTYGSVSVKEEFDYLK